MHSDLNYTVDASLFGSSSRTPSSNRFGHNQIIFMGDKNNLDENVKKLFLAADLHVNNGIITIVNHTDGILMKFKSSNEAEEIMERLSEKISKFQSDLSLQWYEPKDERNVYVTNLPINISEDTLRETFQSYGSIISVKVVKKENNHNCIGFVRYQTKTEAENAISEMNMRKLNLIGSERFVHCELSKIYKSYEGTCTNEKPNAVPQAIPQNFNIIYNQFPSPEPTYIPIMTSIPNPQNIILNQELQLTLLGGQMQGINPVPQQYIHQEHIQPPIVYIPYNPYNTNGM